jgi:hypothetical protein
MMRNILLVTICLCAIFSCKTENKKVEFSGREIDKVLGEMTELMVHDVTNPPLAMRFFSYTCLAGYQVISDHDSTLPRISEHLNGYPSISKINFADADPNLAAIIAMMEVSKKIQPSGKRMELWENNYLDSCKSIGLSSEFVENSKAIGALVAKNILAYAKADRYNTLSNFPRYTPDKKDGYWYPTPPGYFPAVEPYFAKIRNYSLSESDVSAFEIEPPKAFSSDQRSEFYTLANQVYLAGKKQEEQKIAAFWDCNPFALSSNGHLLIAMKKISPGAHWMGISAIACAKKKLDFGHSLLVRTVLSVSMQDAFWVCWREKYHSNRIRPETAVRKLIDPTWKPFLQTPPFPEYPSGHSTVSSTAAVILTHFIGENFSYVDTVETRYGIEARPFKSFNQAAEEASISRFYGGIHFMDGITSGQSQGKKLGNHILKKLNLL